VAGSSDIQLSAVTSAGSGPGAFVFKINAAGNGIVYFTFLGAAENSTSSVPASITFGARPIAADASGNAYLTGYTNSPDFPTTPGAYQTTYNDNSEAFAMKLNPSGTTGWATFLVAISDPNQADVAITLDRSGNVWLTGANGVKSAQGPNFVAELTADGSDLPYLAQFPLGEIGQDIAVDLNGVIHLGGPIGLVSTITPTQPQGQRALSIVNAGSGQLSGMIAPGEIVSL
jgi:hypothetical protein